MRNVEEMKENEMIMKREAR